MSSVTTPAVLELGFLLNGNWHSDGDRIEVYAPGAGQLVGTTHRADGRHVEQAIRGAVEAFEVTRHLGGFERQRILRNIAQAVEKQKEELARIVALEAGKPIKAARSEVERGAFTFAIAAEEAVRIGGEYLPLDWQASAAGRWGIVRRFPLGPIAAITPFNFPVNLVVSQTCARDRRRLPDGIEARAPDAFVGSQDGADHWGGRLAGGRIACAAALEPRREQTCFR
jgi:acyl-CoA reductase-like NAD-dependent aldehyde dehydrogenase